MGLTFIYLLEEQKHSRNIEGSIFTKFITVEQFTCILMITASYLAL